MYCTATGPFVQLQIAWQSSTVVYTLEGETVKNSRNCIFPCDLLFIDIEKCRILYSLICEKFDSQTNNVYYYLMEKYTVSKSMNNKNIFRHFAYF